MNTTHAMNSTTEACVLPYTSDRFFVFNPIDSAHTSVIDCGMHKTAHDALNLLWAFMWGSYAVYMVVYFKTTTKKARRGKKQNDKSALVMKSRLLRSFMLLCLFGVLFFVLAAALDPADYGANGSGPAFVAFWTLWTGLIAFFSASISLTVVVIVEGASAGDRFDAVQKGFKGGFTKTVVSATYVLTGFLLLCTIFFWAICPHLVELDGREGCWQSGCLTSGIFYAVSAINAFLYLYKLIAVLLKLKNFSGSSATTNKSKSLQATIDRLSFLKNQIPPSALFGTCVWIAHATILPCAWWIYHLHISNATALFGVVLLSLFNLPKKSIARGSVAATNVSSAGGANSAVDSNVSSTRDDESTRCSGTNSMTSATSSVATAASSMPTSTTSMSSSS